MTIIWCMVLEIPSTTNRIFCHFFTPLTTKKIKILKNKQTITNTYQWNQLISQRNHPQSSTRISLSPLLFLMIIKNLHKCIKSNKTHHFACDTNLLLINKSLVKINALINHDLTILVQWLKANKISLNTSKTKIIIFQPRQKSITKNIWISE